MSNETETVSQETEATTPEAVEAELTESNVVSAKTGKPLVNGFRDKTVIFPLAKLQQDLEALRKMVQGGFGELQKISNQQLQYVYRGVAEVSNNTRTLSLRLEALQRLASVSEESVNAMIEKIQAEQAAAGEISADAKAGLTVVDRPAANGDVLKIDFVGKINGEAFKGGTAKGARLELGSNTFIPGFEDQLVGVSAGQTVTVAVTFPADYGNKELAGQSAEFETTVVAVKEKTKAAAPAAEETPAQE